MSNEPERPIEKWLRLGALRRREKAGAPFELHPATRRLLQGEIARTLGSQARRSGSLLAKFWPRLAFAAATLLALVGLVLVIVPRRDKQPSLLAQKDSLIQPTAAPAVPEAVVAEPRQEKELISAPVPTSPAPSELRTRTPPVPIASPKLQAPYAVNDKAMTSNAPLTIGLESSGQAVASGGRFDKTAADSAAAGPNPSATAAQRQSLAPLAHPSQSVQASTENAPSRIVTQTPATALSATPPRPSSDEVEKQKAEAPSSSTIAQSYVRVQPASASTDSVGDATGVLASFRLEQAGGTLRVIDSDGSVYTGSLPIGGFQGGGGGAERRFVLRAGSADVANSYAAQSNQSFSFQVSGTNRTLNKSVLFTGKVALAGAEVLQTNVPLGGGVKAFQTRGASPWGGTLSGRMIIGDTNAVQVIARPAK